MIDLKTVALLSYPLLNLHPFTWHSSTWKRNQVGFLDELISTGVLKHGAPPLAKKLPHLLFFFLFMVKWGKPSLIHPLNAPSCCLAIIKVFVDCLKLHQLQEKNDKNFRKWCDLSISVFDVFRVDFSQQQTPHLVDFAAGTSQNLTSTRDCLRTCITFIPKLE